MTRKRLVRALLVWGLVCIGLLIGSHTRARIDEVGTPSEALEQWCMDALNAARNGDPRPPVPGSYSGAGPTFVTVWVQGLPIRTHVGPRNLVTAIDEAAQAFVADERLTDRPEWDADDDGRARFTVEVTLGEGPFPPSWPYLEYFSLVPIYEGVAAEHEGRRGYVTPEEIRANGHYEGAMPTAVPELSPGARTEALLGRLARDMGLDKEALLADGEVWRFRAHTISESTYPSETEVTEDALRTAAVEGAEFLLRHQARTGQYTYVYDGATGRNRPEAYNLPRHSGTTYFLAQVDRYHGLPAARAGAIRALSWIERTHLRRCGDHPCVESYGRADVGSAALTVVAATEILAKAPDPTAQRLAEGLTGFLLSLQRPDGELMHEFDLQRQEPIDVQHMYYSGEAAFALLKAYQVLDDEAILEAARKLMGHLTGAGWNFLGSRYYYGEEHWTCIAAGEGRELVEDSSAAADFCRRWFEFNDALQFREGDTQWSVSGGYGVGPVLLPRLTPVGSRTEAFVSTYQLLKQRGEPTDEVRALVERGLGMLLRWRWAPGPTHLLAHPAEARGGMPGSPIDLTVRNDFVQHGGSAWIRWADVLRVEREAAGSTSNSDED